MIAQDSKVPRELARLPLSAKPPAKPPARGREGQPLRSTKATNYSGQRDEADVLATGFTVREITPQAAKLWLLLQLVGLLFEFNLWREVSSHLADFEDVVARECASEHQFHGVCAGRSWNTSIFEDFTLSGHQAHSFSFWTQSKPPTFLVAVHPVSSRPLGTAAKDDPEAWEDHEASTVHWSIEVQRLRPAANLPPMRFARGGQQVITAEDLSEEAASSASGRVQWQAIVQSLGIYRRNVRFVAFVEDAVGEQLVAVHQHPQCSFSTSWKAFNQQHQGQSHRALSRCQWMLGLFLLVGGGSVYLVHQELEKHRANAEYLAENHPMSQRFHLVVLAKFILQDVPQQVCFVLYIFGWYEAGGLRCQLCLFEAKHCSEEDAFHFSNIVTAGCILASSLANQLLIRPVRKRRYSEDDVCMHLWIRVGGTCVASMPFTTGLCLSSRSLVSEPALVHLLFAIPCLLGWLSISGFCCLGLLIACDDEL